MNAFMREMPAESMFPRSTKAELSPKTDKVVFQVTHWNASDVEQGEEFDLKYLIKMYGVTEEGVSVSLNVVDFTPFFFIKVHHKISPSFVQRLEEYVQSRLPAKLQGSFVGAKLMKKKEFWGFTNGAQFYYIRFTFTNHSAFYAAERIFKREVCIPGVHTSGTRYKLYESNIEPFLRFMHIKDISPAGWVEIPAGKYFVNEDLQTSNCQIDITCDWRCVQSVSKDKIAPLVVASFDLECTSSHGDFPVARKDYKKVAYELLQMYNEEPFGYEELVHELPLIFQHDVSGKLSKVFPKEKQFLHADVFHEILLPKLQRNTDDILNILKGRLVFKKDAFVAATKASKDEIMTSLTRKLGMYNENEWVGIFPRLEGDPIIQIGTTVHKYGETDCSFRHIITLGTCEAIDGVVVETCDTEAQMMMKWKELVLNLDPDVITGYNIFGFDMSYLYDRSRELGIAESFSQLGRLTGVKCAFVEKKLSSSALGDNLLKYYDMDGRVLIDIMKVVQRDHKLDSFKLDTVANHFLKMNKHDVSPNEIFKLQKGSAADRKVVAEYCVQDCALCNRLMMKLEILANNIGMANVCNVPLSFIFMRGQGVKIFSLVAKFCRENDMMIPVVKKEFDPNPKPRTGDEEEEEDGYEGAIVLPPKQGIYLDRPVNVWDYASLYPSSMIAENLSHDMLVIDPRYDNLPGVEYNVITYDIYSGTGDKKEKVGEKACKFVQLPNNEKGVIPRILQKLLKARKDTRKKIEYQNVHCKDGRVFTGLVSEEDGVITVKTVEGQSTKVPKADVMSMEETYNDFEKAVLDGLQLAYKVTANSLYGQIGARTSSIYLKDIAACTTATGRKMIMMAKDYLETHYMAEVVYGDSVANYTPVYAKCDGRVELCTIEDLAVKYGKNIWIPCTENGRQTKEACELNGVETWTEKGWTKLERVIRHTLAAHKKMIRVLTHTGVVDVTDDHSLLRSDGTAITPKDMSIGTELLHHDLPTVNTVEGLTPEEARIMGFFFGDGSCGCYDCPSGAKSSWALNNSSMELLTTYQSLCQKVYPYLDWRIMPTLESSGVYKLAPKAQGYGGIVEFVKMYRMKMYATTEKIIPQEVMGGTDEVRRAFLDGLYDADGDKDEHGYCRIDQKTQLSASHIFWLASSLGWNVSINTRQDKPDIYRLTLTKTSQRKNPIAVKKIHEIDYHGYVYDLTTSNHHFAVGVGKLIGHNTDSIFAILPSEFRGKEALLPSIQMAIEASDGFKPQLKAPHDLEYEKTFWPFILFSKKRYVGNLYEHDDKKFKQKSMGIVLKRRDNANIVKKVYGGCIDIILNQHNVKESVKFLKGQLQNMVDGKCDMEDLIITKSLKSDYKDPEKIAHKVLAERMGERDPGNKPQVNDRIPFVYIETPPAKKGEKILQGNKIEHPDYIRQKNLRPDYAFYITNQIMKPVQQLYALALTDLDGYKKPADFWEKTEKKLLVDKEGDVKKVKDKLADMKEDVVKEILFDPFLNKLTNRKSGNREITEFFKLVM